MPGVRPVGDPGGRYAVAGVSPRFRTLATASAAAFGAGRAYIADVEANEVFSIPDFGAGEVSA